MDSAHLYKTPVLLQPTPVLSHVWLENAIQKDGDKTCDKQMSGDMPQLHYLSLVTHAEP